MLESVDMFEELKKGLGNEGDLCLLIGCHKCGANFELNNQAVAMAILMETPLLEYIRFVQDSKCPKCSKVE